MQTLMPVIHLLKIPTLETLYMVAASSIIALILGAPLGILLYCTEENGLLENRHLHTIINSIVNISRSFPFIILMILLFPLSRIIVGTTIGTTATIVPLSIGAAPFVGRVVESSLKEVPKGVLEASISMGASPRDIILKVLIPEALPSLVLGLTLTIINIVGYSAMAGAIGGGGLGDLAIRYGFHRFQTDVMIGSVLVIIGMVQAIQYIGNFAAKKILQTR
jgi:D-methionine transport system permease protein